MISKFNAEAVKVIQAREAEHVEAIRSLHEARERKYNASILTEAYPGAYARLSAEVDIALKKAEDTYFDFESAYKEAWAEASNALNKPEEGWFKFNKRNKDIPF